MVGQRILYIRVSSQDQNTARQERDGIDRTFIDRASGKDTARPALTEMLGFAREGDTVYVSSMDRLARNLDDLRRIVALLTERGVRVEFLKEALVFTGEDNPMAKLMLSIMGAVAEMERSLILSRQREGIEKARERGVYKSRKPSLTPEQVELLREQAAVGTPKARLARTFGICRETVYAYLREGNATKVLL